MEKGPGFHVMRLKDKLGGAGDRLVGGSSSTAFAPG